MGLEPRIPPNISIANFTRLIHEGNITVLQQLIPIAEYLSQQPPPTEAEFLRGYIDSGDEDDGKEDKQVDTARMFVRNDIIDLFEKLHDIYVIDGDMTDANFEPFIIPNIIQLHNANFESKIQATIPAYNEFIENAPIEHLDELRTTLKAIVRNPPSAEANPPESVISTGDERDDLEMKLQMDIEKLQVKVGGDENKVMELLRTKYKRLPASINNFDDFYSWAEKLNMANLKGIVRYINELNGDNLPNDTKQETKERSAEVIGDDGKSRVTCYICNKTMLAVSYAKHVTSAAHIKNAAKKQITGNGRKTTARKKTIRGKGLSVKDLRARLKLIMN